MFAGRTHMQTGFGDEVYIKGLQNDTFASDSAEDFAQN